jgi:pimeloyl-ACP methyl ester carboxylesterase
MPYVKVGEHEIYYAARGASGAPLVFVHGAGDSHLLWNGQLGAFADSARVFALDLPGHGRSAGPACSSILQYAAVLSAFLDAMQFERAVLAGSSMGGAIIQTLALEFGNRVAGIVLVGTGARLRVAPQFLAGLESDFEATAQRLVDNYFSADVPAALKEKSLRQLRASGGAVTLDDFAACDAFDLRARVKEIPLPTLVLCGREDRMTPLRSSEYLAHEIPQSQLVVIEQAGHLVMLEQPLAFNAALRSWLAGLSR